jgi:hypothetical protein
MSDDETKINELEKSKNKTNPDNENQTNINSEDNTKNDKKIPQLDSEKLERAILAGSVLAGIYFFDYFTAEEWYEKDKDGNFIMKRKDIIKEIFE